MFLVFQEFLNDTKEHSYAILISLKTMTIFNNTSADIKTKSVDILLKMVIVLCEMRIT